MASITRVGMVLGLGLALGWAGFAVGAAGQEAAQPKPKVSDQSLSAEQLAIYKLILKGWMDNGKHAVHLGIETDPFPLDELTGDQSCGKGLSLEPAQNRLVICATRLDTLATCVGNCAGRLEQQQALLRHSQVNAAGRLFTRNAVVIPIRIETEQ